MAVTLEHFNRIIDISFLRKDRTVEKVIKCPRHGMKPDIEINGTFWTKNELPAFNITIKNLYLDLQKDQYANVKVECGYDGNTIALEGTILTLYQESPGPDGKTVIQCRLGNLTDWLEANVDVNFEAGTEITEVLDAFRSKLNVTQPHYGDEAKKLKLKEAFMHNSSAREGMAKLANMFQEERLAVFMREKMLVAICLASGDKVGEERLQFMSAPPQPNTGDEAGTYYTTITAPWMPKLQIGDILTIPSRVYMRNFEKVGSGKEQQIQVTAISFHFGTRGSTNSMTVQGFVVR